MTTYYGHPRMDDGKCPRCASPDPKKHPAVQFEGEVSLCEHPWHKPTAAEIRASHAQAELSISGSRK